MNKNLKAYILCVGDEVLSGKTINTNASFLSIELQKIGIEISKVVTVGDNKIDIKNEVESFINSDIDVLITTGGLGPTHDDFTKETVFETINVPLVLRQEGVDLLDKYFLGSYAQCNLKQAYFPRDAYLLNNDLGTAMGCIYNYNSKFISVLVGPPKELKPMVNNYLIPYFKKLTKCENIIKEYIVMGIGESKVEELLADFYKEFNDIIINPYFTTGKIRYEVRGNINNINRFNEACLKFEFLLNDHIVSIDPNIDIEDLVINEMNRLNYNISIKEDFTCGVLVSKLFNKIDFDKYLINSNISSNIDLNNEVHKLYEDSKSNICIVTGKKDFDSMNYIIQVNDLEFIETCHYKTSNNLFREKVCMNILYNLYKILKKL